MRCITTNIHTVMQIYLLFAGVEKMQKHPKVAGDLTTWCVAGQDVPLKYFLISAEH